MFLREPFAAPILSGDTMIDRFYIDSPLEKGQTVELRGPELHHLAHVMRIRVGETVELINGRSDLAEATLIRLDKQAGYLEITTASHHSQSPSGVTLALPYLRMAKLEWVIEKGTELGADAFWLYPAEYSEKETFSAHQQERLSHIAISAIKQSGRLDFPEIRFLKTFKELIASPLPLFFGDTHPDAPPLSSAPKPLLFVTGPEKGFSETERKLLAEKGTGVRLHRYILRAETAPLAALMTLIRE